MKLTSWLPVLSTTLTSSLDDKDKEEEQPKGRGRGSGRLLIWATTLLLLGLSPRLAVAGDRDSFPGNLNCCTTAGCNCK